MVANAAHPEAADGTGSPDDPPTGVIDELLQSPRRRAVLSVLVDRDHPVTVGDLARQLAATGASTEVSAVDRRRARTELFQEHLPKLTATGVVSFDSLLGTVAFTGPERLAARLAATEGSRADPGTKDK